LAGAEGLEKETTGVTYQTEMQPSVVKYPQFVKLPRQDLKQQHAGRSLKVYVR